MTKEKEIRDREKKEKAKRKREKKGREKRKNFGVNLENNVLLSSSGIDRELRHSPLLHPA
jgi:hypothetical protein